MVAGGGKKEEKKSEVSLWIKQQEDFDKLNEKEKNKLVNNDPEYTTFLKKMLHYKNNLRILGLRKTALNKQAKLEKKESMEISYNKFDQETFGLMT